MKAYEFHDAVEYRAEVVVPIDVWKTILDKLHQADEDADALAEYRAHDREYANWSLDIGARMNDALDLARIIEG